MGNYQTVFLCGCTILHSYLQRIRVLISLDSFQKWILLKIFFDSSHPNGCEVFSHCGFALYFPNTDHLLTCAYWRFVCLLWTNVYWCLLHILWFFFSCSVTQSCPTLCDPMDCSTPGFPVLHHLLELAQTHVHWIGDTIQPLCSLSSPSLPAFNLS